MFRSHGIGAVVVVAGLSVGAAFGQVLVGPWTLARAPGQTIPPVVQCATNAPGGFGGACATLRAVSHVTGTGGFGTSSCIRFVTATTTLTVGPAQTGVTISANLAGFMQQMAPGGGLALVAAFVKLDGGTILDCNPLGPGALYPPAPLFVSTFNSRTLCLTPGIHTLQATLNTYATNHSGNGFLATIVDFFNFVAGVQRGFTVCVTPLGPCVNDECAMPTPVVLGINPLAPGGGNTFSNAGATTPAGYPAICAAINTDVWFSFTPPSDGTYRIDTNTPYGFGPGTLMDPVVAVYTACGPLAATACNDDGGVGLLSSLTLPMFAATNYLIRVGDWGAPPANLGTFYLTIARLMTLALTSPVGPGSLQVDVGGGPPSGTYFVAFTLGSVGFPEAPFFGIDLTVAELLAQISAGPPITGSLDAGGNVSIGPVSGLPFGLHLEFVVLGFEGGPGIISGASSPAAITL